MKNKRNKKDSSSSLDILPSQLIPQFKLRGSNRFLEENEFKQIKLSEDEIKRHLIKEDLNELQRCKILLKKQDPLQQLYNLIEKGNEDIQLEAGEQFVNILKQDIIIDKPIHLNQLYKLSQKMLKIWSEESIDYWKKIFIICLNLLNDEQLYVQAIDLVFTLTEKNQPISSRRAATYLIGKISYIFDMNQQNGYLSNLNHKHQQWIQKIKMISQDVNWEIRAQTASTFKHIFRNCNLQIIESQLLKEVISYYHVIQKQCRQFEELLDDEEEEVQCNALDTIIHAIQVLTTQKVQTSIIDRLQNLFKNDRIKVAEKLIDKCGEILDHLDQRGMKNSFQHSLAEYLNQKLLTLQPAQNESEKEHHSNLLMSFCFNLPGLSVLIDHQIFKEYIIPIIPEIKTVKESLYNLIVSLPQNLDTAINDKEFIIINLILKEVHNLYKEFFQLDKKEQYPESYQIFVMIKKKLLQIQNIIDKDWRNYEQYLLFIQNTYQHMDPQYFSKNFISNMLKNLKKQNHHNKNLIQEILIQILTSTCHANTRSDIHQFMIFDMASSRSSLDRAQYINFCQHIAPKISKRYFQEIFLDSYLNLLDDKQVAIQVALVKSIKEIRLKIDDVLVINKVETYLNNVRNDLNRKNFIREIAEQQFEQLMSQEYRQNIHSSENKKMELNLAAQEMQIYQKEREQSEIDKKKDIDKIMKQAKDIYYNKINQSFTFTKPNSLSQTTNQTTRQSSANQQQQQQQQGDFMHKRKSNNLQQIKTAYQIVDPQKQISSIQSLTSNQNILRKRSTGPTVTGLQNNNLQRLSFLHLQKEEMKRDREASVDNLFNSNNLNSNNNTNSIVFNTILPPISKNWEVNFSNVGTGQNSGENSSKNNPHSNVISSRNVIKSATQGQGTNGNNSQTVASQYGINNTNSAYGIDFSTNQNIILQNAKNIIPIHPNSIKNRTGRKVENIQTQKSYNYKNLGVSPLLSNKKQFELKKF